MLAATAGPLLALLGLDVGIHALAAFLNPAERAGARAVARSAYRLQPWLNALATIRRLWPGLRIAAWANSAIRDRVALLRFPASLETDFMPLRRYLYRQDFHREDFDSQNGPLLRVLSRSERNHAALTRTHRFVRGFRLPPRCPYCGGAAVTAAMYCMCGSPRRFSGTAPTLDFSCEDCMLYFIHQYHDDMDEEDAEVCFAYPWRDRNRCYDVEALTTLERITYDI